MMPDISEISVNGWRGLWCAVLLYRDFSQRRALMLRAVLYRHQAAPTRPGHMLDGGWWWL